MKKIIKYLIKCLLILTVVLIILFVAWYIISFLQYKDEIDYILSISQKEYANFDNSLYQLSVIAEGEKGILIWASYRLYWDISGKKTKEKQIVKQVNGLLWYYCVKLHYSKEDVFILWCHYSVYIEDYGLNNASLKYFGKNIQDLSLKQKATIVAMVKNPTIYIPGSEPSKIRVEQILSKYKGMGRK